MILPEQIKRNISVLKGDDSFYNDNKYYIDDISHSLAVEELIYPLNTYDNLLFEDEERRSKQKFFYFAFPFEDDYRGAKLDPTFYGTKMGLYKDEFKLLDIPFEKGDTVLDLGSNVGAISIVLAKLHPKIQVYAFDANPTAYKLVKLNAKLNGVLNLKAFNLAIGKEELDNVDFFTSSDLDTCALVKRDHLDQEKKEKEHSNLVGTVPQVTLDSLLNSRLLNINKVKYAKIDIEGGEIPMFEDIFENNVQILNKIEYLHIEVHSSEHYGDGYTERGNVLKEKLKDHFKQKLILQEH